MATHATVQNNLFPMMYEKPYQFSYAGELDARLYPFV